MSFENLPGVFSQKIDGNLIVTAPNSNPVVVVIGTAESGNSDTAYRVNRLVDASKAFGKSGTLIRGMYEVAQGGAANLRLFRIGSTPAKLLNIIAGQVDVTTLAQDASAGTDYLIKYVSTTGVLTILRALDEEIVFFFDPADPSTKIDLNEVSVSGTWAAGDGEDIDDTGVARTLASAAGAGLGQDSGATFVAGTDGTGLSRIKLYENLFDAYELLKDQEFDVVVPMDVYLDDRNVMDETGVTVSGLWAGEPNTYPTAGTEKDLLGKLYVEEFEGENRFWWLMTWDRVAAEANADMAVTAQIFPSGVGSASATTKTDGTTLKFSDFHEVNFAYQLARFCFEVSEESQECVGMIGVKPPVSFSLKDVSDWVGKAPVVDDNGVITTNGTGLLGNKFMAGRLTTGSGQSKIQGLVIDGVDGAEHGGFICTDSKFMDDTQQTDSNDKLVDIGKYISVVSAQALLANQAITGSYVATGAPIYAGFVTTLAANSAPSNKVIPSVGLPFRLGLAKLDLLAKRYVHFHAKPKGVVVSDAPTGARPDSDYKRLQTVRIVKACVDAVRRVADPFLGEGLSGARVAALETAIDQVLVKLQNAQFINRYDKSLSITPDQKINGEATVELQLVPAFELRQITVVVSLARQ